MERTNIIKTNKNHTSRDDNNDNMIVIGKNDNETFDETYTKTLEYLKTDVLNKSNVESEWADLCDAYNIALDAVRISKSYEPVHSTHFNKRTMNKVHATNIDDASGAPSMQSIQSTKTQPAISGRTKLPFTIGIVCEWKEGDVWKSKLSAKIITIDDFWVAINSLTEGSNKKKSYLNAPIPSKIKEIDEIRSKLIKNTKANSNSNSNSNLKPDIKKLVSDYNSYHPVWSFVKIDHKDVSNIKDNIEVPFIRRDGKSINDININIKVTRGNGIFNEKDFTGFIPDLILNFAGGLLSEDVSAIVFSRTMVVNKQFVDEGYRLRVLFDSEDLTNSMVKFTNYIQDLLNNDYQKISKNVKIAAIPAFKTIISNTQSDTISPIVRE